MICSLNFKVLSINTPRYLADFEGSIFSSSISNVAQADLLIVVVVVVKPVVVYFI